MDAIRASPNWSNTTADFDPMEKIELEAAEAVARLAHFPANMSESRGNDSVGSIYTLWLELLLKISGVGSHDRIIMEVNWITVEVVKPGSKTFLG
ncbi:hypothetical protein L2E82_49420 [Cichorium intybus]|uniref:Uncharacterized protein n=1 Tax=Cichorium intybus TaxID=13427 RepID=A0ACB8Z1P9_CICIN|nr:hypothetical protein L2E82_49420 [Cichorium intybus]